MAQIKATNSLLPPITISKFLGLNIAQAGDTQLKLGESGNMTNCYITKDYNLSKIEGYLQLMTSVSATKSIQGMWYGNIQGKMYFVFACNGHIYRFNDNYWLDDTTWGQWDTNTVDLGTLTDAPTQFFAFKDNLYIINGYEYKYWSGTGTISDVVGYIPKIRISCKPNTGSGTNYEGMNVLIGKKRMTYKADSTSVYQLAETDVDSIDYVYVNGVLKSLTTHYTVNLANGTVTFTSGNIPAPISNEDDVEIYWTKGTGNRDIVYKNRFAFLFGEAVDTRVFLYGHTDDINQIIFSSLADGVPSAEYFVATDTMPIGSSAYAVTGMERNKSIMLIHTNKPETYYSYYDSTDLDGINVVNFPITLINDARGNVAMGQGQVLNNDPFTIDSTLIKWKPTSVKDERNMEEVGIRIQKDLNEYDLTKAKTIDRQNTNELWISIGKKVWIYNYKLDVFSRLELDHEPTCFLIINGNIFFGTTVGKIMKLSKDYLSFNGKAIKSHWEMNMYNFGADFLTKTLNNSWITLAAQQNVSVDLKYVTDKDSDPTTETKTYSLVTFDDVDFSDFTFLTNYNPQAFRIRLKSKKFTYLKLVIDNISATSTFVVLSTTMQAEFGGKVK